MGEVHGGEGLSVEGEVDGCSVGDHDDVAELCRLDAEDAGDGRGGYWNSVVKVDDWFVGALIIAANTMLPPKL